MFSNTTIIPARARIVASTVRRHILKWSVQRPFLSLGIIVTCSVALLPLITAATLMPLAMLLNFTGILASKGLTFVVYNVVIQGLLIATIIVGLFFVSLFVAASASVFYSYKSFQVPMELRKND